MEEKKAVRNHFCATIAFQHERTKMTILETMVQKQKEMNVKAMGEDWATFGLDWQTAILVETGELIDSLDWKWWKKQDTDWLNARIEAIDILHFALSIFIESNPTQEIIVKLNVDMAEEFPLYLAEKDVVNNCKELTALVLNKAAPQDIILHIIKLCALLGINLEQVVNLYIGKNVLNKFRQDNGYKKGTYTKMWEKEEDNVYMQLFSINHKFNENFEKNLYEHLEKTYIKSVAKS